jgi:hypothetical protein
MLNQFKRLLQKNWHKAFQFWQEYKRNKKLKKIRRSPIKKITILTVPNTLYVADLIKNHLTKKNIESEIIVKKPTIFYKKNLYIVIAAHAFKTLPSNYIAYQLEQYNSGVFKKTKRLRKLKNAILVMDYSTKNIQYLLAKDFSSKQIYHVPIAQLPLQEISLPSTYKYDVAFYGDIKNTRRQNYLNTLKEHFSLNIITNAFGAAAIQQLSTAKIVINIHYYEDALLETTRLYECISNGFLVISEDAVDIAEHEQLQGIIDFVETGNIQKMIEQINYWLTHEAERQLQLNKIKTFACQSQTDFDKQFDKVLNYIQIK